MACVRVLSVLFVDVVGVGGCGWKGGWMGVGHIGMVYTHIHVPMNKHLDVPLRGAGHQRRGVLVVAPLLFCRLVLVLWVLGEGQSIDRADAYHYPAIDRLTDGPSRPTTITYIHT